MIVPLYIATKEDKIAVLIPSECNMIRGKLHGDYKQIWDFLLHTRARIAEANFIANHPECFREENRAIFLPMDKSFGKKKCVYKNRVITLSDKGVKVVKRFLEDGIKFPRHTKTIKGVVKENAISYQNIDQVIKRAARDAGFDTSYVKTKSLRKSMISWMFACFPSRETYILMSAGHTLVVAKQHYITMGFRKDDIKDMKAELEGWGNELS